MTPGSGTSRLEAFLPPDLDARVSAALEAWRAGDCSRRLWGGDATLWTGADEGRWLGWLGIVDDQIARLPRLRAMADGVASAGFTHVLLLGMGGSSLCPEVFQKTFGRIEGRPALHVLDSTDPARIADIESRIDLPRTLFIVSSKSGGTLEPNIFKQYFFDRVRQALGPDPAGGRFVAITDPGSRMQEVAEADRFREIRFGVPSIGGRYSALSDFGLVPGAIQGVDIGRLLDRARDMRRACGASIPPLENPGVRLGAILGSAAAAGRDKVTILASPGIADFGAWLEQLLAESTGKDGKGLIPIDRERPGPVEVYGQDRVVIDLRLEDAPEQPQDVAVERLVKAGQPVVRIGLRDRYDLGAEFFRWEIATAVAGSILGIHPFNQPDVEASKIATRRLTEEYERAGALPREEAIVEDHGIALHADPANARALAEGAGHDRSLTGCLRAHLSRLRKGDYFAILAYLEASEAHEAILQAARHAVRDGRRVATCLGFGPRFLHSTGQAYKGGPNTGVFLQITCDDEVDLPVPGQHYTFGVVKMAQARGDFHVLADRGRRALRAHLGADVRGGLEVLRSGIERALVS